MIMVLGDRHPVLEGDGHYVAPNACLIGSVVLGAASSVWFGAVLRADNDTIRIGSRSNVQDGCVLHTDAGLELAVGDGVTVGHRAVLHGCRVDDNCLIGIGSTILNGAALGPDTIVGAHSLVPANRRYPAGVLIVGSPARVVRELDAAELDTIRQASARYVSKAREFGTGASIVG